MTVIPAMVNLGCHWEEVLVGTMNIIYLQCNAGSCRVNLLMKSVLFYLLPGEDITFAGQTQIQIIKIRPVKSPKFSTRAKL